MASKKTHRLLWIAGAGVGAFVAYRYVYQPWAAQRAALAASGGTPAGGGLLTSIFPTTYPNVGLPGPTALVSTPTTVGSVPSIGPTVPGLVGVVMRKKNWTQSQAQTRLDQLVAAATAQSAEIARLKAGTPNPAAAGIPAAQAVLAANVAALAEAKTAYAAAVAAGDTNGALTWNAAILGHQNDINDLNARIAAASVANDNTAAIAAYEGSLAALDGDYFALTDTHLLGGVAG
jgi:hypothetical protein